MSAQAPILHWVFCAVFICANESRINLPKWNKRTTPNAGQYPPHRHWPRILNIIWNPGIVVRSTLQLDGRKTTWTRHSGPPPWRFCNPSLPPMVVRDTWTSKLIFLKRVSVPSLFPKFWFFFAECFWILKKLNWWCSWHSNEWGQGHPSLVQFCLMTAELFSVGNVLLCITQNIYCWGSRFKRPPPRRCHVLFGSWVIDLSPFHNPCLSFPSDSEKTAEKTRQWPKGQSEKGKKERRKAKTANEAKKAKMIFHQFLFNFFGHIWREWVIFPSKMRRDFFPLAISLIVCNSPEDRNRRDMIQAIIPVVIAYTRKRDVRLRYANNN